MANIVDIITAIVIGLIVIAVSFYLFAMYCHPEEKGFGNALFPKILVILSQALAWGQLLLLPLDLSITESDPSSNFIVAYQIIYPTIFAIIIFLNPFAMSYYQSDEGDSFCARFGWSVLYAIGISAIWCAYVFISYVWVGVYTYLGSQYRLQASMYIFLAVSLIGWILLAFNGGIGLVFLPFDLIRYFVYRPKHLTAEQAFAKKQKLQLKSAQLITIGQTLQKKGGEMSKLQGSWFSRKRSEAKFNDQIQNYKRSVHLIEDEYELFDVQVHIKSTHPIFYVLSLIGGIIGIVASVFWFVQILGTMILKNNAPLFYFMDDWLYSLSKGSASFLATILYGVLVLYLQVCLVKGNTLFGIRVPFIIKFHPLILNKTYMNSLLFNCNLMLLASMSTSLLSLWAFPKYLSPSSLGQLSIQAFDNQPIFSAIYAKRIPMYVMEVIVILSILLIVWRIVWRKCRGQDVNDKPQR